MKTNRPIQNRISKQTTQVSPVEAAAQAGAAYVWQAAYTKGRSEGWKDGWKAAFSGDATTHGLEQNPRKRHAVSVALDEPENENENENSEKEPPHTFELTEECARLFAQSTKASKRQKESQRESSYDVEEFDLGGLMEKRRRYQAMKTYGSEARQIAELEAELAANFARTVADTGASYWPVVPLRDGERPIESVITP